MRVGINSLQVRGKKSGVGQYIYCLFEALVPMAPEESFINYVNRYNKHNYDYNHPNYTTRVWGSQHRVKTIRLLNEYLRFPRQLTRDSLTFLHAPSNLLPIRKVCPYLVTIHDMSYFVNTERYTRAKVLYWKMMTKRTLQLADFVISVSQYSKDDILRFFDYPEDRIVVVHSAPHEMFRPLRDDLLIETFLQKYKLKNRRYILNIGTLEPGKNQVRLVKAFHALPLSVRENLKLVIVGDKGWLYEDIFSTIEKLGLRDDVIIAGHVNDNDLICFYNCAEMLAYPSLNEGFGMPVLEAMACDLPVIIADTSALPEIAGDAALRVEPHDIAGMAEAMESVLTDSECKNMLINKGRQRAKKFSWKKTARKTLEVYRRFE